MLYGFAWYLCRSFLFIFRRMEIYGADNIPDSGGLVLVSNHKSYWDPVIIGCALPRSRQVYFMAKHELFIIPLLGLLITRLGAFPVKRGGADRNAIRMALGHLENGRVLGIFPEGTRSKTEEVLEPHMGAAMLSTRAGVPVLPVAVMGSRGYWGKVRIIFGEPVSFNMEEKAEKAKRAGRKELVDISRNIMSRITGLMDEKSGDLN